MGNTSLVVMAAGMGSRYGGIKQLDAIGKNGEIIMDYSIFDAVKAGFNKITIIIREEIKDDFMRVIGDRIEEKAGIPVHYVYQDINDLPEGFSVPAGRVKPWGTGQAVLAAKKYINEPFLVINADDFYGREAFMKLHDFLVKSDIKAAKPHFCMAGYKLGNTLSENGSVARGICKVDENGNLISIEETLSIAETENGLFGENFDGEKRELSASDIASMNMMGFTPEILDFIEEEFKTFLAELDRKDSLKAEFFLPVAVGDMIKRGLVEMKVINTDEKWFGVTYREDKPKVEASLRKLIENGVYSENLWNGI